MAVWTIKELMSHKRNKLALVSYGRDSFTLEDETTGEVLLEFHENEDGFLELGSGEKDE